MTLTQDERDGFMETFQERLLVDEATLKSFNEITPESITKMSQEEVGLLIAVIHKIWRTRQMIWKEERDNNG